MLRTAAFAVIAGLISGCSSEASPGAGTGSPSPATTTTSTTPPPKTPPPASTTNAEFDGGLPATCDAGPAGTFYSFSAQNLAGTEQVPLCRYRGKVVMVVNVASKCGNTPQYTPLQAIYEKYRDQGFFILAFPCNQFGGQEPGGAVEINECLTKYKVTFSVFQKVDVKEGATEHPLYDWLKKQPGGAGEIEWNFVKFLIDRNGNLVKRWADDVLNSTTDQPAVEAVIAETLKK